MAEKNLMQDKLLPVMVIALIGAAFALGMMWGKLQVYEKGGVGVGTGTAVAPNAVPQEEPQLTDDQWNKVLAKSVYAFGEEDAKVTLVEFTDFQCPFCKRYVDETYSQIVDKYVKTGKVRYMVHDLPLSFHANAKPAAIAARCALNQGKYLEMHDKLFAGQDTWANGSADATFKQYANDLGLNANQFATCLTDESIAKAVDEDLALSAEVGASGTPTFFINGQRLVGAQPYASFEALIEAAL